MWFPAPPASLCKMGSASVLRQKRMHVRITPIARIDVGVSGAHYFAAATSAWNIVWRYVGKVHGERNSVVSRCDRCTTRDENRDNERQQDGVLQPEMRKQIELPVKSPEKAEHSCSGRDETDRRDEADQGDGDVACPPGWTASRNAIIAHADAGGRFSWIAQPSRLPIRLRILVRFTQKPTSRSFRSSRLRPAPT